MNQDSNDKNLILKKRLSTCRSSSGRLSQIPDDLIVEIVKTWELWPGTAKAFYQSLGIKKEQFASIMKKCKRLIKDGKDKLGPFVPMATKAPPAAPQGTKVPIIVQWDKRKTIRFYQVGHLVEFLKKCA